MDTEREEEDLQIYDFEEVNCKMTDIEERARSDESHSGDPDNRSVRASIINSPKNYQMNRGARFSEMSMLSSIVN